MPTWPLSLPPLPLIGATTQDDDAVLRTAMEAGPPSRRRRFTAITQSLGFPMVMDGAQLAAFKSFYRSTLANGALAFDWIDPTDDAVVSIAFKSPPQWALIANNDDPVKRGWRANFELEIQP